MKILKVGNSRLLECIDTEGIAQRAAVFYA